MNESDSKELHSEYTLKALKILEQNASPTQREMARGLNLSLGKINFLIRSLVNQGLIKVERFKNSRKKSAYLYYLTPKGFEKKMVITRNFLKRKMKEYDHLTKEIESLKKDLNEA